MGKSFDNFFEGLIDKKQSINNALEKVTKEENKMRRFIRRRKTERIAMFLIDLAGEIQKLKKSQLEEIKENLPIKFTALEKIERKYQNPLQELENKLAFICNCLEKYASEKKLTDLQEILVRQLGQDHEPDITRTIQRVLERIEAAIASKNHPTIY